MCVHYILYHLFFSTAPTTTNIYTLSLHDALPILHSLRLRVCDPETLRDRRVRMKPRAVPGRVAAVGRHEHAELLVDHARRDRKSTRLNSSHSSISYAVFCLKKKKQNPKIEDIVYS